jgi:hypothetical protein
MPRCNGAAERMMVARTIPNGYTHATRIERQRRPHDPGAEISRDKELTDAQGRQGHTSVVTTT